MWKKVLAWFFVLVCSTSVHAVDLGYNPMWAAELRKALPEFHVLVQEIKGGGGRPSPDGRWMVYNREYPFNPDAAGGMEPWGLTLYTGAGKFVRELTHPRFYYVASSEWSQTSNGLFYLADFSGSGDGMWKLDLRTNSIFRPRLAVSSYAGKDWTNLLPIWSPVKNEYLVENHTRVTKDSGNYKNQIYLIRPASKPVVTKLSDGYDARWSPCGRMITFRKLDSDSPVQFRPWFMNEDGTNQRPLLSKETLDNETRRHGMVRCDLDPATWVSGERCLLIGVHFYDKGNAQRSEVWLVDLNGGILQRMRGFWMLSSSRDGRHFYIEMGGPTSGTSDIRVTYRRFRVTLNPRSGMLR